MQKQAPSFLQMATIVGFVLSCFGLLLYVWVRFGGPAPLAARGCLQKAPFTGAGLLAKLADVRIAGVYGGKVTDIKLGEDGSAIATTELDGRYAPDPADTRAILRQKTLLGETYV